VLANRDRWRRSIHHLAIGEIVLPAGTLIVSLPAFAFAASTASRSEQSASQLPSWVSATFVTRKGAATAAEGSTATMISSDAGMTMRRMNQPIRNSGLPTSSYRLLILPVALSHLEGAGIQPRRESVPTNHLELLGNSRWMVEAAGIEKASTPTKSST
jgi:hypothetical protein